MGSRGGDGVRTPSRSPVARSVSDSAVGAMPPSSRAPMADPRPGDALGDYRVLDVLGSGSMGVVYRAEHVPSGREVALKLLPRALEVDVERRRRFLREARAASAVVHPSLAVVIEAGEADGRAFIAMELVRGRSLGRVLADGGRLAVPEALRVARGIAEGLAAAHGRGVVHRDLKPDNVMIDDAGAVKVLDFGVARLLAAPDGGASLSTLSTEGAILGTPGYMSPEQSYGQRVDARADVFALGALLYEMLTGAKAFTGETAFHVLLATNRDDPPPPSKRAPGVGRTLDQLVARCLAKDPRRRFATAAEVRDAIAAIQASPGDPPKKRWWPFGR
jgi:serine/threonine protein kinase